MQALYIGGGGSVCVGQKLYLTRVVAMTDRHLVQALYTGLALSGMCAGTGPVFECAGTHFTRVQAVYTGLAMSVADTGGSRDGAGEWAEEGPGPGLVAAGALPALVVGLVWAAGLVLLGELVRHHDRKKCRRLQQLLTLEFETLLGQTSPK